MNSSEGTLDISRPPRYSSGKAIHSPLNISDPSYSDVTNCADISSPRRRIRKFHLKPRMNAIGEDESTTVTDPLPPIYSPTACKTTAKLETLASVLVKNIFHKRFMTKKQSSIKSNRNMNEVSASDPTVQQTFQQDESKNDSSSLLHSPRICADDESSSTTTDITKSPFPELILSSTSSSEMLTSHQVQGRISHTLDAWRGDSNRTSPHDNQSPVVSPFHDNLLYSGIDVTYPYLDDTSSPMRRRLRQNLDALYSLYSCSRYPQHLEVDSLVGSDNHDHLWNENTDTLHSPHHHHHHPSSSCTYNFLPLSWLTACSNDGLLKSVDDMTTETEFNSQMKRVLSTDNNSVTSDARLPVLLHSSKELAMFPSILSEEQILQLRNNGVPPTVKLMSWIRAYSLRRDGDCFEFMVKKLANFTQTLVVVQTTRNHILGGYSDIPWIRSNGGDYCGGGRVFLFASNPAMNTSHDHGGVVDYSNHGVRASLQLYHWNGKNNTLRMSSMNRGCFGMGDGDGDGAFGWFVQNDLTSGITGPCESFQSPALTPDLDGIFGVKDIEVWGFLPMLTAFHQSRYQLIHGLKKSPYFSPSEISLPTFHG